MMQNLDINSEEARRFLKTLSGETAPTFQTFDDNKERSTENRKKHQHDPYAKVFRSELDMYLDGLIQLQEQDAGCFVMLNEGAGKIHDTEPCKPRPKSCWHAHNVVKIKALFTDLDGAPLVSGKPGS